jgi:hypothetical protein
LPGDRHRSERHRRDAPVPGHAAVPLSDHLGGTPLERRHRRRAIRGVHAADRHGGPGLRRAAGHRRRRAFGTGKAHAGNGRRDAGQGCRVQVRRTQHPLYRRGLSDVVLAAQPAFPRHYRVRHAAHAGRAAQQARLSRPDADQELTPRLRRLSDGNRHPGSAAAPDGATSAEPWLAQGRKRSGGLRQEPPPYRHQLRFNRRSPARGWWHCLPVAGFVRSCFSSEPASWQSRPCARACSGYRASP